MATLTLIDSIPPSMEETAKYLERFAPAIIDISWTANGPCALSCDALRVDRRFYDSLNRWTLQAGIVIAWANDIYYQERCERMLAGAIRDDSRGFG